MILVALSMIQRAPFNLAVESYRVIIIIAIVRVIYAERYPRDIRMLTAVRRIVAEITRTAMRRVHSHENAEKKTANIFPPIHEKFKCSCEVCTCIIARHEKHFLIPHRKSFAIREFREDESVLHLVRARGAMYKSVPATFSEYNLRVTNSLVNLLSRSLYRSVRALITSKLVFQVSAECNCARVP